MLERYEAASVHTPPAIEDFLAHTAVASLMRRPGGYVLDTSPMLTALTRKLKAEIKGLPVVNDRQELQGVITITDALQTSQAGLGRPRA